MIKRFEIEKVHLALGATDIRKSIDGLSLIVLHVLKLDPFSTHLFAFCNKRRNLIKVLVWDNNGFWIHYKRLESGSFKWPPIGLGTSVSISQRQFHWLLDGLTISQESAHKASKERILI